MHKPIRILLIGAGAAAVLAAAGLIALFVPRPGIDLPAVLRALAETTPAGQVTIEYPLDETLFPLDISAPCFHWKDGDPQADLWLVTIEFADGPQRINGVAEQPQWRPDAATWEKIKSRSVRQPAVVTIAGVNHAAPGQVLSAGRVTFRTSADKVEAPLFYREVNLPFVEAVKDPTTIRWRFGTVSSGQRPPVVLEHLPVCGNCHSFSADGKVLGMDIDYANDKGSYAITAVRESMTLDRQAIITWSDYKRTEGDETFGLLSQVSPDGRFVVSTVKDRSVFVPKPGLDFSQLFFPIKGILCIYDRQAGTFHALPGADDPKLVQSNPSWSPDGKWIVFAATEAYNLQRVGATQKVLLSADDCREFLEDKKPFKFNLYRIPFNDGQGGKAEPIPGASFNGKSNYFARYSPDGKWIVFCQAENYMLLQPDSELYIIPAAGGQARRLRANTRRMNSWHSFSPNGKWLVFSGKPDSPYTRLYLTHIDAQGESTPPVVLDRLTAPDRAANIPEFVNVAPSAIRQIREQFVDDVSYARAAWEFYKSGDYEGAERQAREALKLNPQNGDGLKYLGLALFGRGQGDEALRYLSQAAKVKPNDREIEVDLGAILVSKGVMDEGMGHLRRALEVAPDCAEAWFNLGVAQFRRGNKAEALKCWSKAVEFKPDDYASHHNLALMLDEQGNKDEAIAHYRRAAQLKPDDGPTLADLGVALCNKGAVQEGLAYLNNAVNLNSTDNAVRYRLAMTLARLQQHDQAIIHFQRILRLDPRHTDALLGMGASWLALGQRDKALSCLEGALQVARSTGNQRLAEQIAQEIELFKQRSSQ